MGLIARLAGRRTPAPGLPPGAIRLTGLTKTFRLHGREKTVAAGIDFTFPAGRAIGLLGRNGAGKSSLLQMISGTLEPDAGRVETAGEISWPIGFAGSFHPELTGAQNTRFLARVYGVDTDELMDFVRDFADLGPHFFLPFRTYSSGMRSRLAFGVSMGIAFDTYLVDEVASVGDAAFRAKSEAVFAERRRHSGLIMVSHSLSAMKRLCDAAILLENGRLTYFDDVAEGVGVYKEIAALASGGAAILDD